MVLPIEEQVRDHEHQLTEAIKNSNLTALHKLLHDDLLFLNHNGQIITKATDLEAYQSGKLTILEIISSDQSISVLGEIAITVQDLLLKGKYEQQLFAGQYRYLRVWKACGNHWQVIAGACSLI